MENKLKLLERYVEELFSDDQIENLQSLRLLNQVLTLLRKK